MINNIIIQATSFYNLANFEIHEVAGHYGGRNHIFVCSLNKKNKFVLRVSDLIDRSIDDYYAEIEFINYLAKNGAPVANVLPSNNQKYVEIVDIDGHKFYISLFAYAEGMLICDNGYRYRNGAPLEEYFFNTGKTLGIIHRLSKSFKPKYRRIHYQEKYNINYINCLIPDSYKELKNAISKRLEQFKLLPTDENSFGLIHFDFSDGNYHINMNTGKITVFDFDNCMYCWYMFDLANLWIHGEGWFRNEEDGKKRMESMKCYFDTILLGYRSETEVSDNLLSQLPLFIDMVLIENIVDRFEYCARVGLEVDEEDIETKVHCLINEIPYAGIGTDYKK